MKKIAIIGAGIGGLTTAIALKKKGIETLVFDQMDAVKTVGAGILLASNAMQVYDKLGLKADIEKKGNSISVLHVTKPNLKPLSTVELHRFEGQYGVKNMAIHRGDLQEILLNQLDDDELYIGHELSTVIKEKEGYTLVFKNGKRYKIDVIIGADGIHSKVRDYVENDGVERHADQLCWRGVVDYQLPEAYLHEMNEAWGSGRRFGFAQIAPNKVYWFALRSVNKGQSDEFTIDALPTYFNDFNPLVSSLIEATPSAQIHTAEISDLKPIENWTNGQICLIGDAAHATTPNLGQGACQAIEDAYYLSEFMIKELPVSAFKAFNAHRLKKAHRIVNTSWKVGKMAHLSNAILVFLRNALMKSIPSEQGIKQSEWIFKLEDVK